VGRAPKSQLPIKSHPGAHQETLDLKIYIDVKPSLLGEFMTNSYIRHCLLEIKA